MHAPGQGSRRDGLRWIYAIGVALVVVFVAGFVAKNVRLQWDFRTYRAAAECAFQGLDPYLLENLRGVSGRPIQLPFVYPPVALAPLLPFAALPSAAALWTWIGLKCVALVTLVLIWRRFLPEVAWLPLALAAVFGFNGACSGICGAGTSRCSRSRCCGSDSRATCAVGRRGLRRWWPSPPSSR